MAPGPPRPLFRDDTQRNEACRLLLDIGGLSSQWLGDRPADPPADHEEVQASGLTDQEVLLLQTCWAFRTGAGHVRVGALLDLDPAPRVAVLELLQAVARGHDAIDDWIREQPGFRSAEVIAELREQALGVFEEAVACLRDPDESLEVVLDRAECGILEVIKSWPNSRPVLSLEEVVADLADTIPRTWAADARNRRSVHTGIGPLDGLIGGLHASDLVLLAGRPVVGKTSLALQIAAHAAVEQSKSVLFFSVDLAVGQLALRLLEEKIGASLRSTPADPDSVTARMGRTAAALAGKKLLVHDPRFLDAKTVRRIAWKTLTEHGHVDLIVVDNLQRLHTGPEDGQRSYLAETVQALKDLAREMSVPVLAQVRLEPAPPDDSSRCPSLGDLWAVGELEYVADVVLLMHRAEHYEIIVAKQRNGPTGVVQIDSVP